MNKAEEALELCNKALDIMKEKNIIDFNRKARVFSRKASAHARLNQFESAIEFYEKSLLEEANPKVKDELKRIKRV